jgi:pimeloyl-ACP methyl ester carboxylesterase
MTGTDVVELLSVAFCQGKGNIPVRVSGNGSPLLYLHSELGLTWDNFLADLAADHTVYAPEFPGTAAGDADAIHQYDDLFDVVLAYEEIVRALGLERSVVIGHSFGGMLAAELAAVFPDLFSGVVLMDSFGLWSDTHPTSSDLMAGPYERLPQLLFHDPHCPAAQSMRIPSVDAGDALDRAAACIWAIGCAAKFLWPIPERGLAKRLHRIVAPTLIVWGSDDAVVSVHYASRFADLIAESRVQVIDNCGHIPQLEQEAQTITAVSAFLAEMAQLPNPLKSGG